MKLIIDITKNELDQIVHSNVKMRKDCHIDDEDHQLIVEEINYKLEEEIESLKEIVIEEIKEWAINVLIDERIENES